MPTEIVAVIIRALLQAVAGYLVTKGWLNQEQSADLIASMTTWLLGGAVMIGTIVWSVYQKIQAKRKLEATRAVAVEAAVQAAGVPEPIAQAAVAERVEEKKEEKQP